MSSYYYDISNSLWYYYGLDSSSYSIKYTVSGYIKPTLSLSGYLDFSMPSGYYTDTYLSLSGLFSGFGTAYDLSFNSISGFTLTSYTDSFDYLTLSSYINPFTSYSYLLSSYSISGYTYTGSSYSFSTSSIGCNSLTITGVANLKPTPTYQYKLDGTDSNIVLGSTMAAAYSTISGYITPLGITAYYLSVYGQNNQVGVALSLLEPITFPSSGFTINFNMRTAETKSNKRIFDIFTSTTNSLHLATYAGGLSLLIENNNYITFYTNKINDNIWRNYTLIIKSDINNNALVDLYINKVLSVSNFSTVFPSSTYAYARLGQSSQAAAGAFYGDIYNFQYFNKVLTSTEISNIDGPTSIDWSTVNLMTVNGLGTFQALSCNSLTISGYSISNLIGNSSTSGIDQYARIYGLSLSGTVYNNYFSQGASINTINNTISTLQGSSGVDQYARNYELSLSGTVYSNYFSQGASIVTINNTISTLQGSSGVDQYARNYDKSLSGTVYSNYFSQGASINSINNSISTLQGSTGVDQYARNYAWSLSGTVNTYNSFVNYAYYALAADTHSLLLKNTTTDNLINSLSGTIYGNYYSQGALLNTANSNISTLQTKTTGQSYSGNTTSFDSNLTTTGSITGNSITSNSTISATGRLNGSGLTTTGTVNCGSLTATSLNSTNGSLTLTNGNITCGGTLQVNSTCSFFSDLSVTGVGSFNQMSGFPNNWLSSIDSNTSDSKWLNGMSIGNSDGADYGGCNLFLRSWQGIAMVNTSNDGQTGTNRVKHVFNCRSGEYKLKGDINCGGNINTTSGSVSCINFNSTGSANCTNINCNSNLNLSNTNNHNVKVNGIYFTNVSDSGTYNITGGYGYQTYTIVCRGGNPTINFYNSDSWVDGAIVYIKQISGASFKVTCNKAFSYARNSDGTYGWANGVYDKTNNSNSVWTVTNTHCAVFLVDRTMNTIRELFRNQ